MAELRFGPNTAEVVTFLERLAGMTPADWEAVMEASPNVGSVPDLDVIEAPGYFGALQEATRIAKSNVFPGSESAFYEAMRAAQLVADSSAYFASHRAEAATSAMAEGANLPPDMEAEALSQVMTTAYEEESRRRVMTACIVAAAALVLKGTVTQQVFERLYQPFALERKVRPV